MAPRPQSKQNKEKAAAEEAERAAAAAAAASAERAAAARASTERADGLMLRRCLKAFQEVNSIGESVIPRAALQDALERAGGACKGRDFRKALEELGLGDAVNFSFTEFCWLATQVHAVQAKNKAKNPRILRLYLTPDTFDQYSALFRECAGEAGQLSAGSMASLFKEQKMNVPSDKLQAIMQEVDDDQSGFVDEGEFMLVLVKAAGMKKRKVGPGMCSLASLKEEGWTVADLRKVGYEVKEFLDAGHPVSELLESISPGELRQAGVELADLLVAGWDLLGARQAGFDLGELLQAKCSICKLRTCGWDDVASASTMRKFGVTAEEMKHGGWSLSQLKTVGYSTSSLHLAGFSMTGLAAFQQITLGRKEEPPAAQQGLKEAPVMAPAKSTKKK